MRGMICAISKIGSTPLANGSRSFLGKLSLNDAICDSSVLKAGLEGKSAMWPCRVRRRTLKFETRDILKNQVKSSHP